MAAMVLHSLEPSAQTQAKHCGKTQTTAEFQIYMEVNLEYFPVDTCWVDSESVLILLTSEDFLAGFEIETPTHQLKCLALNEL